MTEDANLPPDKGLEDGEMYMQELVDLIVRVEVADRDAEDYSMFAPWSSTWNGQGDLTEDDIEKKGVGGAGFGDGVQISKGQLPLGPGSAPLLNVQNFTSILICLKASNFIRALQQTTQILR